MKLLGTIPDARRRGPWGHTRSLATLNDPYTVFIEPAVLAMGTGTTAESLAASVPISFARSETGE